MCGCCCIQQGNRNSIGWCYLGYTAGCNAIQQVYVACSLSLLVWFVCICYQSSQEVEVFEVGFFGDSDFLCIICAILPGLPSLSFWFFIIYLHMLFFFFSTFFPTFSFFISYYYCKESMYSHAKYLPIHNWMWYNPITLCIQCNAV